MAEEAVEMTPESVRTEDAEPTNAPTRVADLADSTEPEAKGTASAAGVTDDLVERRSKRPRTASGEKQPVRATRSGDEDSCRACGTGAVASEPTLALLKCTTCRGAVHARCYLPSELQAPPLPSQASWTCDSCQETASAASRECVFCLQPGDTCMRRVDTAGWPVMYRTASARDGEPAWAHALCALWNPFSSAGEKQEIVVTTAESDNQPAVDGGDVETATKAEMHTHAATSTEAAFRARLELPVPACTFCNRSDGVRVQCRRLHCGRFFHARCAHSAEKGYIEVAHKPFPLKHAYCDRHAQNRHDVRDLTTKLASKTMVSLVPRDVATKVQGIARRIDSYTSVDAVFADLVTLLLEMCKRGFKSSKTDPPTFSMRQLQALQLVLDHLPQLRNIYDPATLSMTDGDLLQDTEVTHALQKAFHPQRFVRKFAGPLSQFHQCDACHEPFQERQHVFYCTSTDHSHALHWKCTKRKSAAKDSRQGGSTSTKKKAKSVSLVQQGRWKEVKLPKGLPSIGDGVTCSVCRASVDVRGVLASRKEAARLDFEKPTSEFMFGGCFVNEMDARTAAAAGLRTSRATTATIAQSGVAVALSSSRSSSGKTAPRRSAGAVSTLTDFEGDASALLGPPKMDRINVRRTTRWLACLAEVIRLVSAAKKEAREAEATRAQGEKQGDEERPLAVTSALTEPESESAITNPDGGAKAEDAIMMDVTPSNGTERPDEPGEETATTAEVTVAVNAKTAGSPVPSESVVTCVEESSMAVVDTNNKIDEAAPTDASEGPATSTPTPSSLPLPATALAYLEEAKNVVRPYDAYALNKMESAHRMFEERNGPALSVLSTLIQEYTRFMYIKHTRAVAKASNEKRKREELEAQEERERERKRIDREAELALKKQMLAMRKKQRS